MCAVDSPKKEYDSEMLLKPPMPFRTTVVDGMETHDRKRYLSVEFQKKPRIRRNSSTVSFTKLKDFGKTMRTAADGELRNELLRFGGSTTAHGIPMILRSHNRFVQIFWSILSVCSLCFFAYNCKEVVEKFKRNDKIVGVELQFENAPFPAITICNLNPFKRHLARTVPEISETLDAFHQAVAYSKDSANQYSRSARSKRDSKATPGGFRYVQYEPVFSDCDCTKDTENGECVQMDSVPKTNSSLCVCNFDRQDSAAWPCFNASSWTENICPECNDIGYCNLPETNGTHSLPCLCQKDVNYCLLRPDRLKRLWEIRGKEIPDESSPFRQDFLEQLKKLGYENMTDEVAITTKTKEKLVLTMAGLPVHRRIALSYGKSEFIRMCSFNGKQCDIIDDFKLHVDPAFGNCYMFNHNKLAPLVSHRAGPSYGLRLMVYINSSDYLPTTEATGVRIAIHDQNEIPFPDTFGYSAPTGAVSSFGLSMKRVNRLPKPYGDCVRTDEPLPADYIYQKHKYEPEGCYKSCYQNTIVNNCGCSDPRYPTAKNETKPCDSLDVISRTCLIVEGIKFTRNHTCKCKHPCQQDVYTTTYSAAKWPSGSFRVGDCTMGVEKCIEHYSQHAAMLEIYYEQMSYEVLTESESYLLVNLVSDIGGQAGLWIGASVLTIIEIGVLIFRLLTLYCRRRWHGGGPCRTEMTETPSTDGSTPTVPKIYSEDVDYEKKKPPSMEDEDDVRYVSTPSCQYIMPPPPPPTAVHADPAALDNYLNEQKSNAW
ncbi:hypothetical protein QR680_015306 [Steinernema hermaphroditum]|uniref:Uncharacterized protein n=1 Tax=Steinernema hermaphroditum TaxID=289476 RepID=A0AA39H896_9BILA|nr:hypothetical protein QR680_015306 [Steinernema hermaphroditum]